MTHLTLTQKEFSALKGQLTRAKTLAKKTGDPEIIIKACDKALAIFEEKGYPDSWNTWKVAKEEAETAQRYKASALDYFIDGKRFEGG